MAGYSGTPLPKKLGIKEKFRVAFVGLPTDVRSELRESLRGCELGSNARGPLDFAMLFLKSQAELKKQFPRVAKQLVPAGMLWVSWPKKSARLATDRTDVVVRDTALPLGLVDIKVCSIDAIWSGLKFVIPKEQR